MIGNLRENGRGENRSIKLNRLGFTTDKNEEGRGGQGGQGRKGGR